MMIIRTIQALFLSLLIVGTSYSACCAECIKALSQNTLQNVRIYQQPKNDSKSSGFCGDAFTRDGNCCDQTDASQYAQKWLTDVKKRLIQAKGLIFRFKGHLEFIHQINEYLTKNGAKVTGSKKMTAKELIDFKKTLKYYTEGVHNFNTKESLVNSTMADCYESITTARANTVCLRCSGQASVFWNSKLKHYSVKESVCKQVVIKCARFFGLMADATTFYKRMAQIREADKGKMRTPALAKGLLDKPLNQFRVCGNDPDSCAQNKALYTSICGNLSLTKMNPDLEGEFNTIQDGTVSINQIASGGKPGKNPARRRILQNSNGADNEGDNPGQEDTNTTNTTNTTANDDAGGFLPPLSSQTKPAAASTEKPKNASFGFASYNSSGADLFQNYSFGGEVITDFDVAEALLLTNSLLSKLSPCRLLFIVFAAILVIEGTGNLGGEVPKLFQFIYLFVYLLVSKVFSKQVSKKVIQQQNQTQKFLAFNLRLEDCQQTTFSNQPQFEFINQTKNRNFFRDFFTNKQTNKLIKLKCTQNYKRNLKDAYHSSTRSTPPWMRTLPKIYLGLQKLSSIPTYS